MQIIQQHHNIILRHSLVKRRRNLHKRMMRRKRIGALVRTHDRDESFRGDVVN
jgi:hypothetical protein